MSTAFDPRDPGFIADPFPELARLRREDPVHWSERLQGWVMTGYDDIRMSLRDARFSSDRMRPFFEHLTPEARAKLAPLENNIALWAVFMDPPSHTRLRGLMSRAFTSRAIEGLRARISGIVEALLEAMAAKGEVDLIRDFAYPLPAQVIAEMLGVPPADVDLLKNWSDQLNGFVFSARLTPDKYAIATAGIAEMSDYFQRFVTERRNRPGDDVASGLIAASDSGDLLSPDELVAACVLLLFAGHETTTQLLGNGFLALMRHPVEMAKLRDGDAALVTSAVEEMLRWDGPSLAQVRIMAEDVEVGGRILRRGHRVFQMLAAANRDPAHCPDPDRFDVTRTDNRHLTFGFGIHFCLGAPLARLEGQIAFPALLRRFRRFEPVGPAPRWSDSLVVRAVDRIGLKVVA